MGAIQRSRSARSAAVRVRRAAWALALMLPAVAAAAPAFAQDAELLRDIRTVAPGHSDPDGVVIGGTLWFSALDDDHGRELWKSDGTPQGTVLVSDIAPGPGSSNPSGFVEFGGRVWFVADDDADGTPTLWRTDGTSAGTIEQALPPGADPAFGVTAGPFVADGNVCFATFDFSTGYSLWATDGTAAPVRVFDASASNPKFVTTVDGHGLFRLERPGDADPVALWRTAGTSQLVRLHAGSDGLTAWRVGELGGRTVLATHEVLGDSARVDDRVWISDGSGGLTVLSMDLLAMSGRFAPSSQGAEREGRLYFLTSDSFNSTAELYATDGTSAGTQAVAPSTFPGDSSQVPGDAEMLALPGCVVFSVLHAGLEWWRSDGTEAGTFVLAEEPFEVVFPDPYTRAARLGDRVYFRHDGDGLGFELWRTDGTVAGTTLVKDILPGAVGGSPAGLTPFGGGIAFFAEDNRNPPYFSWSQLWSTDGTEAGTRLVFDFQGGGLGGGPRRNPYSLGQSAQSLFLLANDDDVHGREPWVLHAPPLPDTDGDGLPDVWETDGYVVGNKTVHLKALGADPLHKDLFVEIDYMEASDHTHRPLKAALDRVVNAFDRAPVANPDGKTGIHLHLFVGDALPHEDMLGVVPGPNRYDWCRFDVIRRSDPTLAPAFRYCVFAHDIPPLTSGAAASSGISRGEPGSDFIVSLGSFTGSVGSEPQQAGTFMHELGHCLGLRHGGDEPTNNKPNYLSVMNYLFQLDGLVRTDGAPWLDYSRTRLPDLSEKGLVDSVGIAGGPEAVGFGTKFWGRTLKSSQHGVDTWNPYMYLVAPSANGPIDWDGRGTIDVGPADGLDVNNNLNFSDTLQGYDDWSNLQFRGGTVGFGAGRDPPPLRPATSPADELDVETAKEIALAIPLDPDTGLAETSGGGASGSPSAPVAGVKVTASGSQNVLTWSPAAQRRNCTYRVYRSVDGGYSLFLGSTQNSNYKDRDVQSGRTYAYSVTVDRGDGGESWPSDPVSVRAK